MPNINLVSQVTSATDTNSYFILSDNGLVKRFRYQYLKNQIAATIPGANRTNQNLFTTSSVRFNSVSLSDAAATASENEFSFTTDFYHSGNTAIQSNDGIGSLRFGGFDGNAQTIQGRNLSPFALTAVAAENWNYSGNITTNAGVAWYVHQQPVGIRLTSTSRQRLIQSTSLPSNNPSIPPIFLLSLGSVAVLPNTTLTASNGTPVTGFAPGRTDLNFVNSKVHQYGIPVTSPDPANVTLLGTNVYIFETARNSTYSGLRDAIKNNDVIGQFQFRAITSDNATTSTGALTSLITVKAIEDFTPTQHGAEILFATQPVQGYLGPTDRLTLSSTSNSYISDIHYFKNNSQAIKMTIDNTTIKVFENLTFADNSVQTGASISLADLKTLVAASTSFEDFQARIAAL
jgi:hypothetical protein